MSNVLVFIEQRDGKLRKASLEALTLAADRKMRVVIEPGSALMADRAAQISRELGLDCCLVSCGQEWRRPDLSAVHHRP